MAQGVYWSQHAFTSADTADRVATKLAQQFLPMLDKAMAQRGFRLATGVEVECESNFPEDDWELELDRIGKATSDFSKKIEAKENHCNNKPLTIGRQAQSYPIRSVYMCGANLEFTTPPATPMQSASYATLLKRSIARIGHSNTVPLASPFDRELKEVLQATRLSFDRWENGRASDDIGEHVNLSLYKHNGQDVQRLNVDSLSASKSWAKMMAMALKHCMQTDVALLDSGKQSMRRLEDDAIVKVKNNDRTKSKDDYKDPQETSRVELRLTGASANSWLSMLAATAAMTKLCMVVADEGYDVSPAGFTMLQERKINTALRGAEIEMPLSQVKSPQDVLERFTQYGQIIPLLHRVVDEQVLDVEENYSAHANVERFKAAITARSELLMRPEQPQISR